MRYLKNRVTLTALAVCAVLAGSAAAAAALVVPSGSSWQQIACVKFGQPGSAAGNVMQYDYNDSKCPPGTYTVHLAQYPDADATVTVTATPSISPAGSPSASSSATVTPPAG